MPPPADVPPPVPPPGLAVTIVRPEASPDAPVARPAVCPVVREEARLSENGVLLAALRPSSKPLPSARPQEWAHQAQAGQIPGEPDAPASASFAVSRFALLRRQGDELLLECPLGFFALALHAPVARRFAGRVLAEGECRFAEFLAWAGESGLSQGATAVLFCWLREMAALEPSAKSGIDGADAEKRGEAANTLANLAHWEFHDLLFHAASRPGRRVGRPRPYRWRGMFQPLPVFKPPMGEAVPLPESGLHLDLLAERGFFDVLAARRSGRNFSPAPLRLERLSALLRQSCGVREWRDDALGGVSFRPSPSAGALHGLEIYLAARHCEGLQPGLYHYDPLRHVLERLPGRLPERDTPESWAANLDILAEQARSLAAAPRPPAAHIVVTARFRRYQWKYAQIAYSVMLKDVGCLHQTMSLTAEALDLASVILGDTPAEPFLTMTGLDGLAEGVVGSFAVGEKG